LLLGYGKRAFGGNQSRYFLDYATGLLIRNSFTYFLRCRCQGDDPVFEIPEPFNLPFRGVSFYLLNPLS